MALRLRARIDALVVALTPHQTRDEDADRARFLVEVWLMGLGACAIFAPLNLSSRMWGQVVLTVIVMAVGALMLLLLRRSAPLSLISHVTLTTLTLVFGASALMQSPADLTNLAALVLVPLIASYLLVGRSFVWVLVAGATGTAVLTCARLGFTLPIIDPEPAASGLFNVWTVVVVSWLLMRRFDQLSRAAVERMAQADRAKNIFLATIGHEIRTPMNGVLGMAEVMLQEPQTPTQREQLEVIQRSGRGLVALINDLLDLTQLEARKLTVSQAPFELHALLSDLETLSRPNAALKGLSLIIERAPDVEPVVMGDGLRLAQVLNNLVNNAIKFSDAGEVRVRVSRAEGRLRFEVIDTGIGIDAQAVRRLFRPFEQVDGSSTRRYGGTGLGLAISSQLVGLMGGELKVKSQPAMGSTFSFEIPAAPARLERELREPKVAQVPEPRRRHVLVVDDNPVNLRVAASLVEKAGFTAMTATCGARALALMTERSDVALVLMDCHMPEMDGFEATERIRALPVGAVPIVALTASATPDDVVACRRAGMTEVLAKPIRLDTLREVLGRLLGQ